MTLRDSVPPYDDAEEAVNTAMLAGLATIPAVGGPLVEIASGLLSRVRAKRQYEFDKYVAAAIESLQSEGHPTVHDILDSSEFMAAYEKASRSAAESATTAHRRRLAWVAAQMGEWSSAPQALRQQMFAMVNDMEDSHVRVLSFLDDPVAFISRADSDWSPDSVLMTSLPELIIQWVFQRQTGSQTLTEIITAYLENNKLAQVPQASMTGAGALSCHTTELGRDLLHFIQFPES
ncbi:hypothetical protein [Leifsonia sp. SIMBA_070]|uniref:hypothetical protein n=1 Tax=Leifsonia sp. SIMBA_070 TaxID=3085810 RepID=UPI00397A0973